MRALQLPLLLRERDLDGLANALLKRAASSPGQYDVMRAMRKRGAVNARRKRKRIEHGRASETE